MAWLFAAAYCVLMSYTNSHDSSHAKTRLYNLTWLTKYRSDTESTPEMYRSTSWADSFEACWLAGIARHDHTIRVSQDEKVFFMYLLVGRSVCIVRARDGAYTDNKNIAISGSSTPIWEGKDTCERSTCFHRPLAMCRQYSRSRQSIQPMVMS